MRKLFLSLLLFAFIFTNNYNVFGASAPESSKVFNVRDYGAKGDGVADDSLAIQKAIDEASLHNAVVLFPPSTQYYKITRYLTLRNNTNLSGYGATLFMPSQPKVSVMLYSHARNYLSNVSIKGLKLSSVNDRIGTGEYEGSMTSHVEGISLSGVSGLYVKDVTMENLYRGLKLDASDNGLKNENVKVDHLKVYSSRTPLYMSTTNNFTMEDSILDATGGGTKFLHAAYIRGDVSHLYFNNVQFNNSSGGGIHIYNGKPELEAAKDLVFENCSIINSRVGVYLYSGAVDVTFINLSIKNSGLGFKVNSASDLNMSYVSISEAADDQAEKGAFSLTNLNNALLSNVNIDGTVKMDRVFVLNDSVKDLTVSQLYIENVKSIDFFNSYGNSINIVDSAPLVIEPVAVDASKFVVSSTSDESQIIVPAIAMKDALELSIETLSELGLTDAPKIVVDITERINGSNPVNVIIPVDALKTLEKENGSVVINGHGISFELESGFAVLDGSEVSVKFAKKSVEPYDIGENYEPVSMIYDLDISIDNQKINNFNKRPIITVKLPTDSIAPEKKGAYIINSDKTLTYVMTYYDKNANVVQFKAPHFSQFTIIQYMKTFDDIQKHWAKTNIEEMASKHIINGLTEDLFAPDHKITLAELTAMTLRAIDEYTPTYIEKAKDIGLISGKEDDKENITREDMAAIIAKAHAYLNAIELEDHTTVVRFKDAGEIDPNRLKYVSYLQDKGIIRGFNNTFMPKLEASRAEALSIIREMINN